MFRWQINPDKKQMQCTGALQDFIITLTEDTFSLVAFCNYHKLSWIETDLIMDSDVDDLDANELSCCIYPVDDSTPKSPKIFYREWIKNHGGKIPIIQRNDQDFICHLFLRDVKIRKKLKEFVTEKSMREKLSDLFF